MSNMPACDVFILTPPNAETFAMDVACALEGAKRSRETQINLIQIRENAFGLDKGAYLEIAGPEADPLSITRALKAKGFKFTPHGAGPLFDFTIPNQRIAVGW